MDEEPIRKQPRRRPQLGQAIEWIAGALMLGILVGSFVLLGLSTDPISFTFIIFGALVALSLAYIGLCRPLIDFARRFQVEDAHEALVADGRPPVLYLRSFVSERRVSQVERQLAAMLQAIGPLVAIGRPGDAFPRLGAARLYVADTHWRSEVSKLLSKAQLVILISGKGAGLAWELAECVRLVPPQRLIIGIPANQDSHIDFARQFNDAASVDISRFFVSPPRFSTSLRHTIGVAFGLRSMRDLAGGAINGLISFDAKWQPAHHPVQPAAEEIRERIDAIYGGSLTNWETRLMHALRRAVESPDHGGLEIAQRLHVLAPHVDDLERAAWTYMRFANLVRTLMNLVIVAVIVLVLLPQGCFR